MTTQSTLFILQYNVRNEKNDTMIFLLIDSRIEEYDLLIIQKFWRNVCVSTSYNSFNIDFHLLYQKSKNVRTCFYVNFRLNVNHWSIIFASENVYFFRIRTANDRWINVHNVYNVSFNSYASISTLFVIETIKRQLNDEKKHIILKNFNLHHLLWSDSAKSTQHDAIDQLLNVVHQTQLRFTLSSNTITWKTRNSCNIINLIFIFEELQKKLIHCMIKSKFNQSSDHISISIKIMLEINLKIERQRKTWKKIDVEKLLNFWRDLVASASLNRRQHVEKYAIRIRQSIKSAMNIAVSWSKSFIETKFFWNDRCVDVMTTIKRKRREWTATHSTNVWRNYLRVLNEKKKIINKKKKWNFVEFFELSATSRRDFDVSLVERNLKIIVSEKYQKYLIWFAEIRKIMFLNALMISTSKRDFWSNFFFFIRLMRI
jgi:hypothetical protein